MVLKKRRISTLNVLLVLDAFVLGGWVTLLMVNRLLDNQLGLYGSRSVAAADTILDFMDALLPYYVGFAGLLAVLITITVGAWAWRMAGGESTPGDRVGTSSDPSVGGGRVDVLTAANS